MCVCVDTERPIVVASVVERIYLRRGKVGSTEPATKVSRTLVNSGYIWSFGGGSVRICGRLEFTASEQQADD